MLRFVGWHTLLTKWTSKIRRALALVLVVPRAKPTRAVVRTHASLALLPTPWWFASTITCLCIAYAGWFWCERRGRVDCTLRIFKAIDMNGRRTKRRGSKEEDAVLNDNDAQERRWVLHHMF